MAMKNFLMMAALALVGAIIAGCSGSDDIIDDAPQPATQTDNIVTMKTTVGLESGGETRALTSGGVKTFAVGETMAVFFTNTSGYRIALKSHALTAEDITNGGKSATFTFDFVHPLTHCVPDTRENLQFVYPGARAINSFGSGGVVMDELDTRGVYVLQDGTLETLGNNYDWATFEGPWVGDGNLPADVTLENQIAFLAIKLKDDATDQYITKDLTEVSIDIENGRNFHVYSKGDNPFGQDVIYVGIFPEEINSKDAFHVTATDGTNFYTKTLTGKSYAKGNGYNITWRMTKTDKTAIPLTIEPAMSTGTIVVNNPQEGMKYSLNGGTKITMSGTTTINVTYGQKVQFYGKDKSITCYNGTTISGGTAQVKVYGNIMSLVDETDFATNTTLPANNSLQGLFSGNITLIDASGLLLPATTLTYHCYDSMFNGCTYLETAPELPATTLSRYCYAQMFQGCAILTETPVLPAEELIQGCYQFMFQDCSILSSVTCLATYRINVDGSTNNWLSGVADEGIFYKAEGADWLRNSPHGIPEDWYEEEYGEEDEE